MIGALNGANAIAQGVGPVLGKYVLVASSNRYIHFHCVHTLLLFTIHTVKGV